MGNGFKTVNLLRDLSMWYLTTKKCIDEEGFLLHALERVFVENETWVRDKNLLETLSNKEGKGEGFLEENLSMLWHATRDEMSILLDEYTFLPLLKACVNIYIIICIANVDRYIHEEIIKSVFQGVGAIRIGIRELDMTCCNMDNAMKVFYELCHRDVIVWNLLIRGFYKKDDIDMGKWRR